MSEKSRLAAFLFCSFFGFIGVHRFYVGKIGTGIIWILTLGVFGIGWFVDMILIIAGNFYDKENRRVLAWVRTVDPELKVTQYHI